MLLGLLIGDASTLLAQASADYRSLDRHARRAPDALREDLPALVDYLIEAADGEEEKAGVLYAWITQHISYDQAAYQAGQGRINRSNADILRRGKAVCFGYSTLFRDMCLRAGLSAEVISGYSKGTLTAEPELEAVDHAWNAVRIDGVWRLLDATWGSSLLQKRNDFVQTETEEYWLTPPGRFILHHLPSLPMWQLLDCPVTAATFRQPPSIIRDSVASAAPCFNYADSIRQWRALPEAERRLQSARGAFDYHPTAANRNELGHAYFDLAGTLSDRADTLQAGNRLDSLLLLQDELIAACAAGRRYAGKLYDWQTELHVNALVNQAVAHYQLLDPAADAGQTAACYHNMQALLERAMALLADLPADSFYARQVRQQCQSYLEMVKDNQKK